MKAMTYSKYGPLDVLVSTEVGKPVPKDDEVQGTDRHDLRYDVVVVGGGSAGLSAALVLGRSRRRFSKDHERLPETAEAMIYAAMSRLMLRRLMRAA